MNFFKTITLVFLFLMAPSVLVYAQSNSLGQQTSFYVDQNYDLSQRNKISAVLQKVGENAYFYVDKDWWNSLSVEDKEKTNKSLETLDTEFSSKIYPTLILNFGLEWRPGIDNDTKITILLHPMQEDAGGYFRSNDEYPKLQLTDSNEREMVYLNAKFINTQYINSFLAHEFTHLIGYNQKDKTRGVTEDIWLDEGRADYAPALCGYNSVYAGSNLQRRVKTFLENPNDSITEWQNIPQDYGSLDLFIQYLVDHYGVKILSDSLKSSKIGIDSINYALAKNNYSENFSQVFSNWTITVLINDCTAGNKYCYLNQDLTNLRIVPQINVLPFSGKSVLTIGDATKNWSGNWYKIIGGRGTLKLKFIGSGKVPFKVYYIAQNNKGAYTVKFLLLNSFGEGEALIENFGTENTSLFIIPTIQNKIYESLSSEPFYSFNWSVSVVENQEESADEISKLQAQVNILKKQIAAILAQKQGGTGNQGSISCSQLSSNLYFGMSGNNGVKCLQEFLKSQGADIYPEGLVTGNFGSLTKQAVIKFQEKYTADILTPVGLLKGSGYVGAQTRAKINQILSAG